ncbi:MAG: alpha/beta hydrolase [Alphaproteobacteria bacterium]|nr:alpha/beta hydrolase [Alphaproteobacteria bacterium]
MIFEGFELCHIDVPHGRLRVRLGGRGPALLLLHGNPQTHAMWHRVAPALAQSFSVVCPDLPGYGGSFKAPASPGHAAYSKRAMAGDMAALMAQLGHNRFAVAGHDRGARVAHRLALDFAAQVRKAALLDIIPTLEHFERADMAFAMGYYHWFWLAQPHPFPENVISAAPDAWFRAHTSREPKGDDFFHPDALDDYLAAVRTPEMITGMCEDYRAAATIDLEHDRLSRADGEKIACPVLVLWGAKGKIEQWYDPLDVWAPYCTSPPTGNAVPTGHYLAEEDPDAVLRQLLPFLQDG